MRTFCCCADGPGEVTCQPCPQPWNPALPVTHRVDVPPFVIWGDSAGDGALSALSDLLRDCMSGDCGRQKYRRKALYMHDFTPQECPDEYPDWCDRMIDQDGPEFYSDGLTGFAYGCGLTNVFADLDGSTEFTNIVSMATCQTYTCNGGPASPLMTLIMVQYIWPGDTVTIDGLMADCSEAPVTFTFPQQAYTCIYGRVISMGERYALGAYHLLSASWDDPANTVTTNAGGGLETCCQGDDCGDANAGSACAPTYNGAFPGGPYSWNIPQVIMLTRTN